MRVSHPADSALKTLRHRYAGTGRLSRDCIEECLHSIADENYLLYFDRDPIDRMIEQLSANFSPDAVEEGYSLAIASGAEGARITHNHRRQVSLCLCPLTCGTCALSYSCCDAWFLHSC